MFIRGWFFFLIRRYFESGAPVAAPDLVAGGRSRASGLVATEMHEGVIDEAWIGRKPKWERYRGWPISFVWAWRTAD